MITLNLDDIDTMMTAVAQTKDRICPDYFSGRPQIRMWETAWAYTNSIVWEILALQLAREITFKSRRTLL